MYIIVLINYVYYKTNIEVLIVEIHLKLKTAFKDLANNIVIKNDLRTQYSLGKFNMSVRLCKSIVQAVFLIINFIGPVPVSFDEIIIDFIL